jgi:hypothetical protein
MANPFPFTAGQVLTAAQLNGIGETTSFTPTWNGLTVGNAVQSFKYVRVQNLVYVFGKFTFGTTTSLTSNVSFSPPVATTNQPDLSVIGQSYLSDSGGNAYIAPNLFTANLIFIQVGNVSGTYFSTTALAATTPFTWSVNDYFTVAAVYTI